MDHREIDRLKKNPEAFRSLARQLLRTPGTAWTEWELDFLESMSVREPDSGPSTRQCEVLLDLRDSTLSYSRIDGFSVQALIENTWRARFDLGDDDERFVDELHALCATSVKRRQLLRLLVCARKVDVIDSLRRL